MTQNIWKVTSMLVATFLEMNYQGKANELLCQTVSVDSLKSILIATFGF